MGFNSVFKGLNIGSESHGEFVRISGVPKNLVNLI